MAAGTLAAEHGARTLIVDEHPIAGGQVYRRPLGDGVPDRGEGFRLRSALRASGVEWRGAARVWSLGGGTLVPPGSPQSPFRLDLLADGASTSVSSRALILCPGTTERVVPFPGWTLPGVIGLAAATILLKADRVVPGRRVVVAGQGPLLAAVAAGILAHRGTVVAVIDYSTRGHWWRALPALASRPGLLARGGWWVARILAARVPILSGYRLLRAEGEEELRWVVVGPANGGPERRIDCDALCVGHGLVPATEAASLFRAAFTFAPARGGWVPDLDPAQRTTIPFLYVAGDGAGIAGAAAAPISGRIAALAALCDLGLSQSALGDIKSLRHQRQPYLRFGNAMAALMTPDPMLYDAIPEDCIICRCEDVTRAEIEAAIAAGAREANQLKQFTRCGMGPCQGRMCGETAAALLARHVGGRVAAGRFNARLPLRPVPLDAILGDFDYADIPVPAPAPT